MNIALRDYQQEALEAIQQEFQAGVSRQLIILPTGSGKTVLMAAVAKHYNKRTLLLAHREELITQAKEKFKLFWPDADIGICMADSDEVENQIIVGSVQSCSRAKRLERLKEQKFDLLMIDEAHHSSADSYQRIIQELGFLNDKTKLLLGVTATPKRSDKQHLGDVFEKITFSRSIATMIKANYLSPAIGRKILTNFTLNRIQSNHGDFAIEELAEAVNTFERNDFIAEKFLTYANDRKAIAFCVDVKHCHDLSDAFRKRGIESKAVWGDMPLNDRKQALHDLKTGKVQIATSCGVLTEGFDEPSIDAIVMARPTKSQALYIQCVGRGLRLWPGKQNCLVLDFTDRGHNLDSVMSLSCTIPEGTFEQEKSDFEREEIDKTPKISVFDECDKEFDILGSARFIWVRVGEEWSLLDDDRNEIIMRPQAGGYVATLYFRDGNTKQIVATPLPLNYCSGLCEDYARRHLKVAFADMSKPWMNSVSPPTQGQIDYLKKQGVFCEDWNKTQASFEIRKIIALKSSQRRLMAEEPITDKQMYYLQYRGINTNGMTKLGAMQAISKLKQKNLAR